PDSRSRWWAPAGRPPDSTNHSSTRPVRGCAA
ncbi:uncharacterized protein METZ01_LOCUS144737, partial [marine metagenome]